MSQAASTAIEIQVSDVTRQKNFRVSSAGDSTIGELVTRILGRMGLIGTDANGDPLQYRARRDRDGRALQSAELVRDALEPEDQIVLQPRIHAG